MALQPGFDRYEGLAFFGYTRDGEGHDAIINIGQNFIEIKNSNEQVLSIWAPHSFECNDLEIPMRCYFSGDEWIAPHDRELADFLDGYLALEVKEEASAKVRRPKWHYAIAGLVLGASVFLVSFAIFQSSLSRLIDNSIAARFDEKIRTTKFTPTKLCDLETEPILRDFLREKAPEPNYEIVQNLGANFLRMPSGKLAIDQQWISSFSGEDTLIALINLVHVRNEKSNPAREFVDGLPFVERFKFLRSGALTAEQIDMAWEKYKLSTQIDFNDIKDIQDPIGNFPELAAVTNIAAQGGLPNIKAGLEFGDQDWLTLITLCPLEPLG